MARDKIRLNVLRLALHAPLRSRLLTLRDGELRGLLPCVVPHRKGDLGSVTDGLDGLLSATLRIRTPNAI